MIQVINRMLHHLRSSMHLPKDGDIDLRRRIRSLCGVGIVEGIIAREIVHNIRVVGLRYIVCRRHKMLGMLVKAFLVSMQHWTTNRQTIRHLSLTWTVSFVSKLFLF